MAGFLINVHLEILVVPQKTPSLFINGLVAIISLGQKKLKILNVALQESKNILRNTFELHRVTVWT